MVGHVDAAPSERDAFGFQTEALLKSGIAAQLNLASGAKYAMPGQSERMMKRSRRLTRPIGVASGPSHVSVRADFSAGNTADGRPNRRLHLLGFGRLRGCPDTGAFTIQPDCRLRPLFLS